MGRELLSLNLADVNGIAVQLSGAAQNRFDAFIVEGGRRAEGDHRAVGGDEGFGGLLQLLASGLEDEVADAPSGEGARGFLDVLLAVVALAEGEELHHLAGEVLVRMADLIGEDHVAFGTDINGMAGGALLTGHAQLREVVAYWQRKRVPESRIRKIAIENYARVLSEVFRLRQA